MTKYTIHVYINWAENLDHKEVVQCTIMYTMNMLIKAMHEFVCHFKYISKREKITGPEKHVY